MCPAIVALNGLTVTCRLLKLKTLFATWKAIVLRFSCSGQMCKSTDAYTSNKTSVQRQRWLPLSICNLWHETWLKSFDACGDLAPPHSNRCVPKAAACTIRRERKATRRHALDDRLRSRKWCQRLPRWYHPSVGWSLCSMLSTRYCCSWGSRRWASAPRHICPWHAGTRSAFWAMDLSRARQRWEKIKQTLAVESACTQHDLRKIP